MLQQTSKQLTLCVNIPLLYIYISVNRVGATVCPAENHSNRLTAVGVFLPTASYRNHVTKKALAFSSVSLAVSVHSVVFHSILHQKRQGGLPFVDTTQPKIARMSDVFKRACFN